MDESIKIALLASRWSKRDVQRDIAQFLLIVNIFYFHFSHSLTSTGGKLQKQRFSIVEGVHLFSYIHSFSHLVRDLTAKNVILPRNVKFVPRSNH